MQDQKNATQQELAKQFIIEAEKNIADKNLTFSVITMYPIPHSVEILVEQMDRQTVLQLLDHYSNWDSDLYVCGVCCHLLQRLAQLAPEEALALYEKKIGISKVKEILKLSDEENEEDREKNPKAIPTLSLMAMMSGYPAGKPGSRALLQALKSTIPWQEISRAFAEDQEELVGESGMLCVMIFYGIISEECKVHPDFALEEWRTLPLREAMKIDLLTNLTDNDEIPFRVLQNDVESTVGKGSKMTDELEQLAFTFAKRVFTESPQDAEQWLAQHKLPLKEQSDNELGNLLAPWTPENHSTYFAWSQQLESKLRSRIAVQKMEEVCVSLANSEHASKSEMPKEWDMLDSLLPQTSSPQRLALIKEVAKKIHNDDEKSYLQLLRHLKFSELEVQSLLAAKKESK